MPPFVTVADTNDGDTTDDSSEEEDEESDAEDQGADGAQWFWLGDSNTGSQDVWVE